MSTAENLTVGWTLDGDGFLTGQFLDDEADDGPRWAALLRDRPGWIARHRWSENRADRRDLSERHAHLRGLYSEGRDRRPSKDELAGGVPVGWIARPFRAPVEEA